jgi:hypothetical protein
MNKQGVGLGLRACPADIGDCAVRHVRIFDNPGAFSARWIVAALAGWKRQHPSM